MNRYCYLIIVLLITFLLFSPSVLTHPLHIPCDYLTRAMSRLGGFGKEFAMVKLDYILQQYAFEEIG